MDKNQKVVLFHLYREDGSALFLHPFDSLDKFLEIVSKTEIMGKYGDEPRVESLTIFRNDLYRMIEDAVNSWITEKRFIPRFLISSAIFLVAYLGMSLIVRDPLPMIDEILIAVAAALGSYFLLSRRDRNSSEALKRRVALRTKVDRIVFSEDSFVKEVEEFLHHNEATEKEKLLESMMIPGEKSFRPEDIDDAKQLIRYLERRFSGKDFRKQERLIKKLSGVNHSSAELESLSKWVETKKVDLSLFATYTRIKKFYNTAK